MPSNAEARATFLAERKKGIGGSDIASVFNVGYGCALRLWREKRGEVPDYPQHETDAMELGVVLEPFFAHKYERATGRTVIVRDKPFVHPEHPELRVNVDRMIDDPEQPDREVGVLEIKSVGREVFQRIKREGLPEDYILQLQHGILVTGAEWGSFAIGSRDSGELLWWDVERDPSICEAIVREATALWKQIQEGSMPERLEPDDRRCQKCEYRRSCQGAALIQLEPSKEIEQDETLRPLLIEYLERRQLLEEATALADESKEELKTRLGQRTAVEVAGHKVYFRPQTSMRGDFIGLAATYDELRQRALLLLEQHPEIGRADRPFSAEYPPAESFRRAVESRPLRIY